MNFYKRHLGDIAKACSHLSQGQMGAYDLLLDWLYGNEKPLPLDPNALYRIGRAVTPSERENVDTVLAEFFQRDDHGYTQKRALEEIGKANAQAETNRRIAAEREARKRERTAHDSTNESINESLNESSTNRSTKGQPSQTPDTRLKQGSLRSPSASADDDLPEGVDAEAWEAWSGHWKALRKWSAPRRMLAIGQLRQVIRAGADPNALLRWALARGLADLADAGRRMAADAGRVQGESLADAAARQIDVQRGQEAPLLIPMTGALAHES